MYRMKEAVWRAFYSDASERIAVSEPRQEDAPDPSWMALAEEAGKQVSQLAEKMQRAAPESAKDNDREIKTFAKSLINSLDGLDRMVDFATKAVETNPDLANWLTSLKALQVKQLKTLESIGLTPMDCIGCKLDLNLHEVVRTVRNANVPPETVVEVAQKGYFFRGRVLRDAKVVVAE